MSLQDALDRAHASFDPVPLAQQICGACHDGLPETWLADRKRYLSRNDVYKAIEKCYECWEQRNPVPHPRCDRANENTKNVIFVEIQKM